MRIGTWNAHEGLPSRRVSSESSGHSLASTVQSVAALELDALALQEVDIGADGISQLLSALTEKTLLRFVHSRVLSPSALGGSHQSGVALMSRWPLGRSSWKVFDNPGLEASRGGSPVSTYDKGMVSAVIDVDGVGVGLASLHSYPFHYFGRDARDQAFSRVWDEIAKCLDGVPGDVVVIGGDFNTYDRSLVIDRMGTRVRGTVRAGAGARKRQVDDILHSRNLRVRGPASSISTSSDHDLFFADFELTD